MEEKQLIGISIAGKENKIGSVVLASVTVKPNFFRRIAFMNLKNPGPAELNKIVDISRKLVLDYKIHYIRPSEMQTKIYDDLEMTGIIDLLNSSYRFWNQKIFIQYDDRNEFINRFVRLAPGNLLMTKDFNLYLNKWYIGNDEVKILQLAKLYAQYYLNIELNEIRAVWGELPPPNCPHIRIEGEKENGPKN